MTKAETEQAIIKIEDLFKKIGINKALRVRPHEESVVKRLLAGGMSADEILEKLK